MQITEEMLTTAYKAYALAEWENGRAKAGPERESLRAALEAVARKLVAFWRDDALAAAADIARRYGAEDAARDIAALTSKGSCRPLKPPTGATAGTPISTCCCW